MKSGSVFCVTRLHVTEGLSISLKKEGFRKQGAEGSRVI
jgi:hypothetical protein